jgi:hypothetical protein
MTSAEGLGRYVDPLLQARIWCCADCGADAYPTDADWLTGELLLATFSQPHRGDCRSPRTWSAIVSDVARDGASMPYAPGKNSQLARAYYRRNSCRACGALAHDRYCDACRCEATTTRGRRCANRRGRDGSCGRHGGRRDEGKVTEKMSQLQQRLAGGN